MLSNTMLEAFNAQINAEFWSAYLYLSMAMDADAKGLKGLANWYRVQFKEEQDHATILINYVQSRDGRVSLRPIAEVPTEWKNAGDMLKDTLAHEQKVTAMINNLAVLANKEGDIASANAMIWFIDEQIEEESNARDLINAYEACDGNKYGLYMLDKELGARTYTTPSPLAGK